MYLHRCPLIGKILPLVHEILFNDDKQQIFGNIFEKNPFYQLSYQLSFVNMLLPNSLFQDLIKRILSQFFLPRTIHRTKRFPVITVAENATFHTGFRIFVIPNISLLKKPSIPKGQSNWPPEATIFADQCKNIIRKSPYQEQSIGLSGFRRYP